MKALKNITNKLKSNKKILIGAIVAVIIFVLLFVFVIFPSSDDELLDKFITGIDSVNTVLVKNINKIPTQNFPDSTGSKNFDKKKIEQKDADNCHYILAKIYSDKRLYEKSNVQFEIAKEIINKSFLDSIEYFEMNNYWELENYDKVILMGKNIDELKIPEAKYIVDRSIFELAVNQGDTTLLNDKLREYKSKYQSNKNNYNFVLTYAYLLYKSGVNCSISDKYIDEAIKLNNRRDFYPYSLKGLSFINKKEYKKSEKYFNKILSLYPYDYNIHLYLGKSFFYQKKYLKALRSFEVSLAIMKSDIGFYNCGITYLKLKNDSLAFDMFKNGYKYNRKNINNLFEIVKIYDENGHLDKSILLCENIIKIIKDNYGKLGIVHKKYVKYLISLYLKKETKKFDLKAKKLVYKLCVIDPKDQESLEKYEEINGEIFRIK